MKTIIATGVLLLAMTSAQVAQANARIVTCVGQPVTAGKAIGDKQSSVQEDSVIGNCFFFRYSDVGDRIHDVCYHIGQLGTDRGGPCWIRTEVAGSGYPGHSDTIKRIIKIKPLPLD
jgi:hypothetical protein